LVPLWPRKPLITPENGCFCDLPTDQLFIVEDVNCCDHGLNVYRYVNGKPMLIEAGEAVKDANDDTKTIVTLKKRVNGKMVLVKRTIERD
jgi:hypothetical protein